MLRGCNPGEERAAPQGAALRGRRRRLPRERVLVLLDAQPIQSLVVRLLLPDVFGYRGLIQPDGGDVVPLGPELPVPELVFEVAVLLEDYERALAFEVPHEIRNAHFGRYADQHVHVVGHQVPFDNLDPLVRAEPPEYLPHTLAVLVVNNFPSILRCEHDVVLAYPLRVRQAVRLLRHRIAFLPCSGDLGNHHCRGKAISCNAHCPPPAWRVVFRLARHARSTGLMNHELLAVLFGLLMHVTSDSYDGLGRPDSSRALHPPFQATWQP